ncbi:hypothetical protein BH09ACT5_BH09ACT5_12050 [soil metagenome]
MTDQVPTPAPQPTPPPAPAYTGAPVNTRPWNVLSIVSLVASLVGFGIVGIITGHIALSQIKKTGEQGRALALAGTIIGYVAVGVGIILFIFWIGIVIAAASSGAYYN